MKNRTLWRTIPGILLIIEGCAHLLVGVVVYGAIVGFADVGDCLPLLA